MYRRYTSEQLKKLAMGTMFIDHAAVALIYNTGLNEISPLLENIGIAMRLIGRMAFPLYTFLLVQGFLWTRDWRRYAARVAGFALVSEVPYDLVAFGTIWNLERQNTMFTMLVGLLCMKMFSELEEFRESSGTSWWPGAGTGNTSLLTPMGRKWFARVGMILTAVTGILAADFLRVDYGSAGILLILVFYMFRFRPAEQLFGGCIVLYFMYFNVYAISAWIAIFLISRYNGERGRKMGYLPYIFYPAHLLVVWLAGEILCCIKFVV